MKEGNEVSTAPVFHKGTLRHFREESSCPGKRSKDFSLSRNELISYQKELRGKGDFQKIKKNISIVSFQNLHAGSLRYPLLTGISHTKPKVKPEILQDTEEGCRGDKRKPNHKEK